MCEARAPGGSGSAPVGRPLRPSPQRRAPPARYRLETCPAAGLGPRPLPAACPKSSGASTARLGRLCKHYFTFYSFPRPPRDAPPRMIQVCIGTVSQAKRFIIFDTRGHRTGVHTHASGDTDVHGSTRHRRSTLRKPRHWSAPQSCSDPNLLGLEASTSHSHPHVVPALSAASAVSLQSRSPGLATRRPRPRPLRSPLVLSDLISDLIWSSQISSHPLSEVAGVGLELLLDALEIRLSLVRVDALL